MKIDLSRINLNLLVAFDALIKEQHVTRAGQRLHISQSAMSNVLKQLRDVFNDELFIRGQRSRMIPTKRALELTLPVAEALERINIVFQKEDTFNPQTVRMTFTLGMSDYTNFVLLPLLTQFLSQNAPEIDLVIKPTVYLPSDSAFENDELDIAIGIYCKISDKLISQTVFTEESVCIGCYKNPLMKQPLDAYTFATAKQILILYQETRSELYSEQYLKQLGLDRRIMLTVPDTCAALYSLANTELICMVLKRMAEKIAQNLPLAIQPAPFSYKPFPIHMVWHPKHKNNPAHRWLRNAIKELTKNF